MSSSSNFSEDPCNLKTVQVNAALNFFFIREMKPLWRGRDEASLERLLLPNSNFFLGKATGKSPTHPKFSNLC